MQRGVDEGSGETLPGALKETEAFTVDAPAVFGDEALWFAGVTTNFTARSLAYTEVIFVPVLTLLSIASKDSAIRQRYRVFRDVMREAEC